LPDTPENMTQSIKTIARMEAASDQPSAVRELANAMEEVQETIVRGANADEVAEQVAAKVSRMGKRGRYLLQ
jgi:hypothetical protein